MPPDDVKNQALLMMLDARMKAQGAKASGFDPMFHPEDYAGDMPAHQVRPKHHRRSKAPDMSASDDALLGKLQDAAYYGVAKPEGQSVPAKELGLYLPPKQGLPFYGIDPGRVTPDDMELLQDYLRRHAGAGVASR